MGPNAFHDPIHRADSIMTRRLYYEDAAMRSFQATVVDTRAAEGASLVALDATAFYPGGGGQPSDRGTLGGRAVLDVVEDAGQIWHRLEGPLDAAGGAVSGSLDWSRRFDHMQQHTGQHILSRAFVEIAKADTRSFHMGEAAVTIDVDHPGPDSTLLARVEDRANEVVWDDGAVVTHVVAMEEAVRFPLRKAPDVDGPVRVVEVGGFDWSACGGTHVGRAGQVGLVAILGTEKYKGGTRVSFVCGGRALARLRVAGSRLRDLCLEFTTGEEELPRAVARLREDRDRLDRRLKPLLADSLEREAADLMERAEQGAHGPVVAMRFSDRDPAEIGVLASLVAARGGIALLVAGGDTPRAHFSAPKGTISVGGILAALNRTHGAKGGGRPESAQGAIPADRADAALSEARAMALAGTDKGNVE
jgi:alanyl-tRNA synthetase